MSCTGPTPPIMVGREYDHAIIGNYMKKKHWALSQLIGKAETCYLSYSLNDFRDLLTRMASLPDAVNMKVYFATYCFTGDTEVDRLVQSGNKDLLTVIFAPADMELNDLGEYYLISPAGGTINLSTRAFQLLISAYQKGKVPLLEQLMKDAGHAGFRETKMVWISLGAFVGSNGFLSEAECEGATDITLFVGTYPKSQLYIDTNVEWQMAIILVFAKTYYFEGVAFKYHFDIEDMSGYERRDKPMVIDSGDTFNPCPPATGC